MNAAQAVNRILKDCPRRLLKENGRVIYSAASTFRPGKLYIMGLNPGGDPKNHPGTVRQSLLDFPKRTENAYLDEKWRKSGASPLQQRLCWLTCQLGCSLRNVFATNLIFVRTQDRKSV